MVIPIPPRLSFKSYCVSSYASPMKTGIISILTGAAVAALVLSAQPRGAATTPLTIEQLIDIRHPSTPMWAPDGRRVAFVWDRAGVSKVYVADASGAAQPAAPRELPGAG